MGQALTQQFTVAADVFAEADDALQFKLSALCFEGPEDKLRLTTNAQPAILATSVAALRVLEQETALQPVCVTGHSLGEYTALVAAGAVSFADAVRIVRERGRLMQEAVPAGIGGMAALMGLSAEDVAEVCAEAAQGEVVSPANLNGGGQIVVAGHVGAVNRAIDVAKARGAKRAVALTVSAPFHCVLMSAAAEGLKQVLEPLAVQPLSVDLIPNVTAQASQDHSQVKSLLFEQMTSPVRWEESMQQLGALGCQAALEIGPGRVLSGLLKRIDSSLSCASFGDPKNLDDIRGHVA
jgi:[acyl-carrier-protein] S-malonyltransferase